MVLGKPSRLKLVSKTMSRIKSYVFLDLETCGLPGMHYGSTKITELTMISALRSHLEECNSQQIPRVLNKMTLCFHPQKHISNGAAIVSGLSNELLEEQTSFNEKSCDLINMFLSRLPSPICFIAHNGYRFDFPILMAQMKFVGKRFPESILCSDSLLAFRELEIHGLNVVRSETEQSPTRSVEEQLGVVKLKTEGDEDVKPCIEVKETTPTEEFDDEIDERELSDAAEAVEFFWMTPEGKDMIQGDTVDTLLGSTPKGKAPPFDGTACRTPRKPGVPSSQNTPKDNGEPPDNKLKPRKKLLDNSMTEGKPSVSRQLFSKPSYKLSSVYSHLFGEPLMNAHSAEADSMALLKIVCAIGAPFHDWVQANHRTFSSIQRAW